MVLKFHKLKRHSEKNLKTNIETKESLGKERVVR